MPRTPPLPPGLIERTAVACARLDAAASRSVVRDGWLQRSRIDAALRAATADGQDVDRDRLLAVLFGLKLRRSEDGGGTARALRWLKTLLLVPEIRPETGPESGHPGPDDGADAGFGPASVTALPPDFDGLRRAVAAFVGARQSRSAGILPALADGLSAASDS